MFYLTTHSTHFIYGYIASDMVKTIRIAREETWTTQISSKGSFIFIIPQTGIPYHGLRYTSRGTLPKLYIVRFHHEGSIRRSVAP